MKEILLTKGYVAIVDDEDYETISRHKWNVYVSNGTQYARRSTGVGCGKTKVEYMHRIIANAIPGLDVDHIDGDGLNNTRANLRVCSRSENLRNKKSKRGASMYKGVSRDSSNNSRWRATIFVEKKLMYLGSFGSEREAAHAYDAAALKYFGKFARVNTYTHKDEEHKHLGECGSTLSPSTATPVVMSICDGPGETCPVGKLTVRIPTDCASAIRTVLYLRGWRTYKPLADAMGLADTTMLSRLVRYKAAGTDAMRDRVLEHMPKEAQR